MSDEKPMEIRDQFALQILNGLLCMPGVFVNGDAAKTAIIRDAYQMADLMRKIRLATFE